MRKKSIFLITGNKDKLKELRQIFPRSLNLDSRDLDIVEIQSLDPYEIITDKLKRAYSEIKAPVIAEDVSVELSCLNGLPGPFVKFFIKSLGRDALWHVAKNYKDRSVIARCVMGYYNGKDLIIAEGSVKGKIVSPRGENGFGFDYVFQPDGHKKTTAEMEPSEKNKISWRGLAARELAIKLKAL